MPRPTPPTGATRSAAPTQRRRQGLSEYTLRACRRYGGVHGTTSSASTSTSVSVHARPRTVYQTTWYWKRRGTGDTFRVIYASNSSYHRLFHWCDHPLTTPANRDADARDVSGLCPSAQLLVQASRQKLPHRSICICVWTSLHIARAIARAASPLSDTEGGDATSCFFLERESDEKS